MTTRFRDIADIRSGFPFRGRVENDPAGELAVIHMRDIQPGSSLAQENLLHIDAATIQDLDRYLLTEGDVIFQARGHHNRAAAVEQPLYGIVALGLYRIRPDQEQVTGAYLAWYLNQDRTRRRIANVAQGTQIPFIPRTEVAMLPVPLPSFEIQQKITNLHRIRERQRQLQRELDELTDQLLSEATWHVASSTD